jgi:hypothetical protein
MIKTLEQRDSQSCWNKAADTEMVFVLLARDAAAPHAIREWVKERIRLNKNTVDDYQVKDALAAALFIERTQAEADQKSGLICVHPVGSTTCGYTEMRHHKYDGSPMDHAFTLSVAVEKSQAQQAEKQS